ncbi:Tigger transposable element-derived protein 6 [Cucumispora dikerogammari]|nr:Tigger transposable element-derived protein 6 [Cucumispora dikerogammari]
MVDKKNLKTKRKQKTHLTIKEKIEIIKFSAEHPSFSNVFLSDFFTKKFKKEIDSRSIGNYLKNKENLNSEITDENNKKHKRSLVYDQIENKVLSFVDKIEIKEGIITDDILIRKAVFFAEQLKINEFKAFKGWLNKFKKRNNYKLRKLHEETFSEEKKNFSLFFGEIKTHIERYGKENIYNV